MIFISIASYRDKELVKTVQSCFANAKYPQNIRVGICWQYDETENTDIFDSNPKIQVDKVYWKDVQGSVCWARHRIQQKFFNNEDYYFQVDSHTLFAKNWDEKLINMMEKLSNRKNIISIGPPYYYDSSADEYLTYESSEQVEHINGIYYDKIIKQQKLDSIASSGYTAFGFLPATDISNPIRTRHISAALLFTVGNWVTDVPYDPHLYFTGEEAAITLRSFTNGYDIYSPNELVCWHLKYYFPNRKRHWNTFDPDIVAELEHKSGERYRKIVCSNDGGSEFGIYGLGNERTMLDWEIYSGISFVDKVAHPDAYAGIPPNPITVKNLLEWTGYKRLNAGVQK